MRFFRRRAWLALVFVLALTLAACGSQTGEKASSDEAPPASGEQAPAADDGQAKAETLHLSFATTMDDSGIDKDITQYFAQRLNEISNGQLAVDLYMAGQMGSEKEALEMMKLGELDMGYNAVHASMYYPEYNITQVPFLFPDMDSIRRFYESTDSGARAQQILREKGGVIYLGMHDYGPRWTTSNVSFKNPDELKGLKIRMPNIPIWVDVWAGMGASPTPIAATEIVTALKTGTVDAQENFLTNIVGRKMWEIQKYLIATKHVILPQTWLISEKTWNKLTPEQQQWVQQAVKDAIAYESPKVAAANDEFVKEAEKNGMTIVEPDRDALRAAAQPAIQKIIAEQMADGVYEDAMKAIGK